MVTIWFSDFDSIQAFIVNWDCPKLLLISRDVWSNTVLQTIDKSPVFCEICSSKINRSIQQVLAPTSTETSCSMQYHQRCHGLTPNQTWHTNVDLTFCRNFLNTTLVLLILLIIYVIFLQPARIFAPCKLCSVAGIQFNLILLTLHIIVKHLPALRFVISVLPAVIF